MKFKVGTFVTVISNVRDFFDNLRLKKYYDRNGEVKEVCEDGYLRVEFEPYEDGSYDVQRFKPEELLSNVKKNREKRLNDLLGES